MALAALMTRPVVIHQRVTSSAVDEWGNQTTETYQDVDALAYLEQTDAEEITSGQETYVSRWKIALPSSVGPLTGRDQITVTDLEQTFAVVGRPARPWRPSSGEHHIEARLVEVEG